MQRLAQLESRRAKRELGLQYGHSVREKKSSLTTPMLTNNEDVDPDKLLTQSRKGVRIDVTAAHDFLVHREAGGAQEGIGGNGSKRR